MSGGTNFAGETSVSDWPLVNETGVASDDGFCQDETIAFGIADRPTLRNDEA